MNAHLNKIRLIPRAGFFLIRLIRVNPRQTYSLISWRDFKYLPNTPFQGGMTIETAP